MWRSARGAGFCHVHLVTLPSSRTSVEGRSDMWVLIHSAGCFPALDGEEPVRANMVKSRSADIGLVASIRLLSPHPLVCMLISRPLFVYSQPLSVHPFWLRPP